MKKTLLFTGMTLLAISGLNAQVLNRAISLTSEGTVDCGQMPNLDNLSSYSLQLWLCPDNWSNDATVLSRGADLDVSLGTPGNLILTVGNTSLTASSTDLKTGEWNQVTYIVKDGVGTALVNGNAAGSGNMNAIPVSESEFVLGGGYQGLLDEVRIWNDALNDDMKTFDYFTNNTLNKWCPMWDNLVAYYKMDQENCPYLVDYKGIEDSSAAYDNHGIMSTGVSKVVAANDKMPYLVNAAYTENDRFFDRIIPRDQYLLSNEIIILGANCVAATGHVVPRTPNNHATTEGGAAYLSNYEGREGVLALDGAAGSRLVCPAATWNNGNSYMFETWLYLDEWTPGAYLFRKENNEQTHGLALYLGDDEENPTLVIRVDGKKIVSRTLKNFEKGKWNHVGLNPTSSTGAFFAFNFFSNGTNYNGNSDESDGTTSKATDYEDFPIYLGEGLKGKLDETCLWNKTWSVTDEKGHMTYVPLPSPNRNVRVADMDYVGAYYRFDDPEFVGFSSHSQDNWANIMRSAYEGHYPPKISLSVRGHGSADNPGAVDEFNTIMNTPAKRQVFAQDLAEMSKNYDGVELDLEWVYNASGWTNYHQLSKAIMEALPEGKTFRISTHNVTYEYPKGADGIENPGITGFTFQQYGPQKTHFNYNTFTARVNNFLNYGYPADKILTSYSTTTSKGDKGSDITGVRTGAFKTYKPGNQPMDTLVTSSDTFYYIGPMQVYNRAKFTREKNLQGIFYWDMGNDYWEGTPANPIMPEYNSAKYCSYAINSNCDTIVTNLNVAHYGESGVKDVKVENKATKSVVVSGADTDVIKVSFNTGEVATEVNIYSLAGVHFTEVKGRNTVNVANLGAGVYVLTAKDRDGVVFKTKFVRR